MEERLNELEKRIEKLERKEKRRTILSIVKIVLYIVVILGLCFGAYVVYNKVMETIEPYREIVEKYNEADNTIKSIKDLFKTNK